MKEFETVLLAVLPVFCLAGAGVMLRRVNWLTADADASLFRITVNILIPCLIIDSVVGNKALERAGNVLIPPLIGFATILVGIGAAWSARRLAGLQEASAQRTFAFAAGIYNYGYVPIPLATLLFDSDTVGVLLVHNVGVEIALWTVGVAALRGRMPERKWRQIVNPPLAAIVFALALNFSGLDEGLSGRMLAYAGSIQNAVRMLGQCAIPLGLVLIGATIADEYHQFTPRRAGRVMGWACLLRLGVLPVIFLAAAKFLPLSIELKRVIVLQAAMPAAVFPIIMTRHFGGDTATALRVVIATSVAALLTIPLWIQAGLRIISAP